MAWLSRIISMIVCIGFAFGIDALAHAQRFVPERLFALAGLYVTLAVSLNLINGITGQFSIGHAAFYQVGAYVAGFLTVRFFAGQPLSGAVWLILMMLVGAVAASISGFIVGLPSLRLRGDYLAIVTLGFGEIIRILVQNIDAVGGSYGFNVKPKFEFIWLIWLLAMACIGVCRNLLKTAHGLPFLAVREDEIASSAMGVDVTRVKVAAFVLGSAFAGAAGALLAHYEGFINPTMFSMDLSFIILTMIVLGGTGSITGSVLAGITLFFLPELLRDAKPVTGDSLLAGVIAVIVAVAAFRRIGEHFHGQTGQRIGLYFGAIAGAIVVKLAVGAALHPISSLNSAVYEANKLRMVIFAATLIILMLLRPQGVFAHHEFSWDWLLRRKARGLGVSS